MMFKGLMVMGFSTISIRALSSISYKVGFMFPGQGAQNVG